MPPFVQIGNAVLDQLPALGGGGALGVYAAIARHADAQGKAWPGIKTVALLTGYSQTRVKELITELEKCGLLIVERSTGLGNRYFLPHHPSISKQLELPSHIGRVSNQGCLGEQLELTGVSNQGCSELYTRTISKNKIKRAPETGKQKTSDQGFQEFYTAYPRHTARPAAEKAYVKVVAALAKRGMAEPAAATFLMDRVKAFAESDVGRGDIQFVPHPATWLNQGRFDDDPAGWQRQSQNGNGNDGNGHADGPLPPAEGKRYV
jgi:hypothetical protein